MSKRPTRAEFVRDCLLAELRAGKYGVAEKLPNEDELARQFDVSRATVREAVQGLMEIGYLTRQARARHVRHPRADPSAFDRYDRQLYRDDPQRRHGTGETVVDRQDRPPTPDEADRLGVGADEVLVCIQRVRTADGVPAVYSEDRIPGQLLAGFEGPSLDTSL